MNVFAHVVNRFAPWLCRPRSPVFSALAAVLLCGCACSGKLLGQAWEARLKGDEIVLLGEVHDNAVLHRSRLQTLQRALEAGWRPAIAMEQFDRERQADIDRARKEKPGDAQHVIDATTPHGSTSAGWDWDFYRPVVELALRYDLPLVAANVSNADAARLVRGGYAAVFDAATIAALGLDRGIAADWSAAQQAEIDAGHCHLLPPDMLPAMARAQFARDAAMAEALRAHAARGVVLLAGDGHVRRDIGVPRWLGEAWRARVFTVGFVEAGDGAAPAAVFDAVVSAPAASRPDPCEGLAARHPVKR